MSTKKQAMLIGVRESMEPMLKIISRMICCEDISRPCRCACCQLTAEVKKLKWLGPCYVCRQDRPKTKPKAKQ